MDRLILLRHGQAEHDAVSGDDFDRALTAHGRAEAGAMGRLLAVSGSTPDLALVSSAVRAVQTYEAVRPAFPKAAEQTSRTLYLASPRDIMAAIREAAPGVRTLMVVGHNPGIHDMALALARDGDSPSALLTRLERGFPTASAAVFDFDAAGTARLAALHLPPADR